MCGTCRELSPLRPSIRGQALGAPAATRNPANTRGGRCTPRRLFKPTVCPSCGRGQGGPVGAGISLSHSYVPASWGPSRTLTSAARGCLSCVVCFAGERARAGSLVVSLQGCSEDRPASRSPVARGMPHEARDVPSLSRSYLGVIFRLLGVRIVWGRQREGRTVPVPERLSLEAKEGEEASQFSFPFSLLT